MGDAKQCDRCGELYRVDYDNTIPYEIKSKTEEESHDMCTTCEFELEDWFENPEKFSKKKDKRKGAVHKWSPEKLEEQRERMKKTMGRIHEIKKEHGCTHKEAFEIYRKEKAKEKGEDPVIEETEEDNPESDEPEELREPNMPIKEEKQYVCTVCFKAPVPTKGDVCNVCAREATS